jgi:hypothetical protein
MLSSHHPLNTVHPAFEDGTDRGFRNVGKSQSDAREISKRTHTKYRITTIDYIFHPEKYLGLENFSKIFFQK